jgi:predicted translin family RNA/ssDNA-binding protein
MNYEQCNPMSGHDCSLSPQDLDAAIHAERQFERDELESEINHVQQDIQSQSFVVVRAQGEIESARSEIRRLKEELNRLHVRLAAFPERVEHVSSPEATAEYLAKSAMKDDYERRRKGRPDG